MLKAIFSKKDRFFFMLKMSFPPNKRSFIKVLLIDSKALTQDNLS